MKVAVVGATGLVGRKMLQVLEERNFPVTELIPVASERSVGKEITFKGKNYKVMGMRDAINMKPQLAIFSAGGETSLEWAPQFAAAGITVVDNSSAWRMDPTKKLVIPEINANTLTKEDNYREPELLNNTDARYVGTPSQKIRDQTRRRFHVPIRDRKRFERNQPARRRTGRPGGEKSIRSPYRPELSAALRLIHRQRVHKRRNETGQRDLQNIK